MYKLYYSPGACSIAAHAILRRIGHPFALAKVDTRKGDQRLPEYLQISPRGRVPVLAVESEQIAELTAILLFLADRHTEHRLLPPTPTSRARCVSWMSYLQSTVHPFFAALWRTERFAEAPMVHAEVARTARKRLRDEFFAVDAELGKSRWLLGESRYLCDYNLFALARWASAIADVDRELPNIGTFVRQMAEDSAVAEVLKIEDVPLFRESL